MRLEPTRMSMVAWMEGRREQTRATTRARDRQDCIWGGLGRTSQTSVGTG